MNYHNHCDDKVAKLYNEVVVKDYSEENTNFGAVFISGRMNPPTIGHQLAINVAIEVAKTEGKELFIFVTRTQDRKKNPLSFDDKIGILDMVYPDVKFIDDPTAINPFMAAYWLRDHGFKDVVLVAGSDRIPTFQAQFANYMQHPEPKKSFDFTDFRIESGGERDEDGSDATGASATEARQLAIDGNIDGFANILPHMGENLDQLLPPEVIKDAFDKIRANML